MTLKQQNKGHVCGGHVSRFLRKCSNKLAYEKVTNSLNVDIDGSEMVRCLTTFDLISLGFGGLSGCNFFVLPGIVIRQLGLAGIASTAVGTLASLGAGLHYAELSSVCPNTSGSAYLYVYVTLGELAAFVVGWTLFVEYLLGACVAAAGLSNFANTISGGIIHSNIYMAMARVGFPKIDFVAVLVFFTLTMIVASGIKLSSNFVKGLNVITFMILAVFFSLSFYLGSAKNLEQSGFAPFGLDKILSGLPIGYFVFVGFDGMVTLAAECKSPTKSIPIALASTIIISFVTINTCIVFISYDLPLDLIPLDTGILDIFSPLGFPYVKYILASGAFTSLVANLFGALIPLPRIAFSMAQDDLIFKFFAKICPKRRTPFRATIAFGIIGTLLVAFVDFNTLLNLSILGAVKCYTFVIVAAILLRYEGLELNKDATSDSTASSSLSQPLSSSQEHATYNSSKKFNLRNWIHPKFVEVQTVSRLYLKTFLGSIVFCITLCCLIATKWHQQLMGMKIVTIFFTVMLILVILLTSLLMTLPQSDRLKDSFRSPLIPYISIVTVALNIYVLTSLERLTWYMYCGWMGVGLSIYVIYGCRHTCLSASADPTHESCNEWTEVESCDRDRE